MDDQFRQIEGYPGYRVSRDGVVQSCWGRGFRRKLTDDWHSLKPIRREGNYYSVNLHRDGKKTCASSTA